MTDLPPHFLTRPDWTITAEQEATLSDWSAREVEGQPLRVVSPPPDLPVWVVLAWLGERRPVLLHGTGDSGIRRFTPRQPQDHNPFGAQRAVYAASDGVWAMFYAVHDRSRFPSTIVNASFTLEREGARLGPLAFFSVAAPALALSPWRDGWVYVLPREGFVQEPRGDWGGYALEVAHWASERAVTPLARLAVRPADFPFLSAVRAHDEATLHARMRARPDGFPWLDP